MSRVQIRLRSTFDSSATPKAGEIIRAPKRLADVDLEKLKVRMAAAIEEQQGNDPRELKKKIAELERKLQAAPAAVDTAAIEAAAEERGRVSVAADYNSLRDQMIGAIGDIENAIKAVGAVHERLRIAFAVADAAKNTTARPVSAPRRPVPGPRAPVVPTNGNSALGNSGLRRILIALAQKNGLSARQVGVRAGLSSSSGTFTTYLSKARTEGWVTGERGRLEITPHGLSVLGDYNSLPTGRDLLDYWLVELGESGAARILRVLAARKHSMSAEEVAVEAGLSASSGTFTTYLSKLRTLELVEGKRDSLRASEDLF
jgi:hypothetical protein